MITLKGVDSKMIANNLIPSEPIHPGEILKDEIEYRGISQRKLARQMGISPTLLNEILNGKRSVTSDFALMVEAALGINPELLINMQTRYNMALAREKSNLSERLKEIRTICASLL